MEGRRGRPSSSTNTTLCICELRQSTYEDERLELALGEKDQVRYPGLSVVVSVDDELPRLKARQLKPYLDDFAQICGTKITETLGSNQVALGLGKSYAICVGADEA